MPESDYVARLDPVKEGFHLWTDCGEVEVPATADSFTIWCDRTSLPDDRSNVIKVRAEMQLPDGTWQLLASFSAAGGVLQAPPGVATDKSWFTVPIAKGSTKLVRVKAVMLKDIRTSVGVRCGGSVVSRV